MRHFLRHRRNCVAVLVPPLVLLRDAAARMITGGAVYPCLCLACSYLWPVVVRADGVELWLLLW